MQSSMHQREYERLKRQFKLDYEKKIAALELIYEATNTGTIGESGDGSSRKERTAGLKDTVRKILPNVGPTFSLNDVAMALEQDDSEGLGSVKKASLSSVLKRLEEDGIITVVERGSGKRASVYKLASSMSGETREPQ